MASLCLVVPPFGSRPLGAPSSGGAEMRWPLTTDDAPWDFFEIPAHSESALRASSSWEAGAKGSRSSMQAWERLSLAPWGIIWQNQIN